MRFAFGLAVLLFCVAAHGEELYQSRSPVFGCVDPQTTRAINAPSITGRPDPAWTRHLKKVGDCYRTRRGQRWELIGRNSGMPLLRLSPPRAGIPPLYFLPQDVVVETTPARAPEPAAIAAPAAAAAQPVLAPGAPSLPTTSPAPPVPAPQQAEPAIEPAAPPLVTAPLPAPSLPAPPSPAPPLPPVAEAIAHTPARPAVAPAPAPAAPIPIQAPAGPTPMARPPSALLALLGVLLVALVALLAGLWWRSRRLVSRLDRAIQVATREILANKAQLQVRRAELTSSKDGMLDERRWARDAATFADGQIVPALERERLTRQWPAIEPAMILLIEDVSRISFDAPASILDPVLHAASTRVGSISYERHCLRSLNDAGWIASPLPADGDDANGIIARRDGDIIFLKCRLREEPVDSDLVTEAASAARQHRPTFTAIVANVPFTASACQLAVMDGVFLLHHDDLASFSFADVARKLRANAQRRATPALAAVTRHDT